MKTTAPLVLLALLAASSSLSSQQEKPVPKDSARLSISGCARGRVFTVRINPEHEMSNVDLVEGRKLRLEGPKKVLEEIKAQEKTMIVVTGLIKRSEIEQQGIGLAGGRVRIGPAVPSSSVPQTAGPSAAIFDVESYRLLNASCPSR